MSGRLLRLVSQPIAEAERQRLFALAVAVLLVVAGALQVIAPAGEQTRSIALHPASTTELQPAAPREPAGPSAVTRAGREFLADYLAFVHGQGPTRFRHASAPLARARLAGYALRISPATRARRAHVVRVAVRRLPDRSQWLMTAAIADGSVATYPLELVIAAGARSAVVVQVGED